MDNGKVRGLDNLFIEIWKCLGGKDIVWLTKLFNEILRSMGMLDGWKKSIFMPIYKNKGDIQNYRNY